MFFSRKLNQPMTATEALPGRAAPIPTAETHMVSGRNLKGPYPEGFETIIFALGCYWGAERKFWQVPGVCSGGTGHAESVLVVFDPRKMPLEKLLKVFWEAHDPTQGMRQGNDVGSQYRSAIYWTNPAHEAPIRQSVAAYQKELSRAGYGKITTELAPAGPFFFAEDNHQQYLAKNPGGYCGLGGTGVTYPVSIPAAA
jgi:peptide-methionine (S)-S-oxide reductase